MTTVHVPAEIHARIVARVMWCIERTRSVRGDTINFPIIRYNLRGTTAGKASPSKHTIQINSVLLMENVDDYIENTVPHEVAHLMQWKFNPESLRRTYGQKRDVHGYDWKKHMHDYGLDAERCHNYDVSSVHKKRERFELTCRRCLHVYNVTSVILKRIKLGYTYSCQCGGALSHVDLNDQHREVLRPAAKQPERFVTATTGRTKMDICRSIFEANRFAGRAAMINMFVRQAGCTPAGASAYYQKIKND